MPDTFTVTPVPNDLIPYEAGIALLTPINADGSEGTPVSTNTDFVISATVSTTREEDNLTNGNGNDKPFPKSEKQSLALVVNSYSALFHSVAAGRTYTIGTKLVKTETSITITSDSAETPTYGYTFPNDTVYPTADAQGNIALIVMNAYNQPFEKVNSAASLAAGQFYYDSDTKRIQVAATYNNTVLTAIFDYSSNSVTLDSDHGLTAPEFKITLIDTVQSAKTTTKYGRIRVMTRAVVSGDLPEAPSQKDINTNMTYNFVTATVPTGMVLYSETFYPIA
jgi:hypothetical protein